MTWRPAGTIRYSFVRYSRVLTRPCGPRAGWREKREKEREREKMDIAKGASSDVRRIALRDGIARRKPLARNNQRLLLFCAVQSGEPHSGLVAFDNFIRHGRPYVPVPSSPPVARIVLSRFIIDPRIYSYTSSQVRRLIHGRHVCKPRVSPGELSPRIAHARQTWEKPATLGRTPPIVLNYFPSCTIDRHVGAARTKFKSIRNTQRGRVCRTWRMALSFTIWWIGRSATTNFS